MVADAGAGAETFALKPAVTLNGPWVTAGDLLTPRPTGKLAELRIKNLVPPGGSMEIQRDLVLLKMHGARLGSGIQIDGQSSRVTASRRMVPGSEIKAFAEKYLKERVSSMEGVSGSEIEATAQPSDLAVPDREVRFEIPARTGQVWRGNIMLGIKLMQTAEDGNDLKVGEVTAPFMVKVRRKLLLASKGLRRGEVLTEVNTVIGEVDCTFSREDGYTSMDQVAGLKARSSVAAGVAVLPSMLERPALVKRGDVVKLVVRVGMIAVESSAKVMRDGAEGDMVPVQTVEGKKQLQARVLDSRTVVSDTR